MAAKKKKAPAKKAKPPAKKKAAPTVKKKPRKKPPAKKGAAKAPAPSEPEPAASESSGATEANVERMHAEAEANGGALPDESRENVSTEPHAVVRDEVDDTEAEAALEGSPPIPLAEAVRRAMRFSSAPALVQVSSAWVIGMGVRGAVFVPFNAPALAEPLLVDGKKLARSLQACGPQVELSPSGTGVVVKGAGHRFALKAVAEDMAVPAFPAQDRYTAFDPTLFKLAAAFAGDPKIEPPELGGVSIQRGWIGATDRHTMFYGLTGENALVATLPADTFDDVNEQVFVALDANGNVFVCIPSTGEYRMVVPFGGAFPNVRLVAESVPGHYVVEVPKAQLLDVLRKTAIVQKRTSSVKIDVFPSENGPALEVRAESPEGTADFVTRLDVTNQGPHPTERLTVLVGGDSLLRLAKLSPSPTAVSLTFGANGRDPVMLQSDTFRAVVSVMSR